MANNAPAGFMTVDDALKLNKDEIRELQMKHQNGVKLELAEMLGIKGGARVASWSSWPQPSQPSWSIGPFPTSRSPR